MREDVFLVVATPIRIGYGWGSGRFVPGMPHENRQEPRDGVHGKNREEWIDGMPETKRTTGEVVRQRENENAQRQRHGIPPVCSECQNQPGERQSREYCAKPNVLWGEVLVEDPRFHGGVVGRGPGVRNAVRK